MSKPLFKITGTVEVYDEADLVALLTGTRRGTLDSETADEAPLVEVEPVDTSPQAITEAEAVAATHGWDFELARSWCAELPATRNGRLLHELPVAAGGYVTASEMRIAAGRPASGPYGLTGFTGGVAKRFDAWKARNPRAAGLELPVVTDYDHTIKGRQRAKGFEVHKDLVPLFRIALEVTKV